jgi:FdhD protein
MSRRPEKQPLVPPAPALSRTVNVRRWRDGQQEQTLDEVAEEVPVAFTYHGIAHVVMLATPADLEDLGVGFTFTEALVERSDEIRGVEVVATFFGVAAAATQSHGPDGLRSVWYRNA